MKKMSCFAKSIVLMLGLLLVSGCAGTQVQDYTDFRTHPPRSILVLPPMNESVEVNAPYIYLSTISRPLAECGYYVFPVAVIDAFLKENGLPTPGEMHSVSLRKIQEIIGADAVLYVTIEDWGQKYKVLSSNTIVKARAHLVHVDTGKTIWVGSQNVVQSSGDSGGGVVGMLVSAVVSQVVSTIVDPTHDLSKRANDQMVFNRNNGFLWGKYHTQDHASEICSH